MLKNKARAQSADVSLFIYFFNPRKTPLGTYERNLNQINIFLNLLTSFFCGGVRKESSLGLPCESLQGTLNYSKTFTNTKANTTHLAAFACLLREGSASLLPKAISFFFFFLTGSRRSSGLLAPRLGSWSEHVEKPGFKFSRLQMRHKVQSVLGVCCVVSPDP